MRHFILIIVLFPMLVVSAEPPEQSHFVKFGSNSYLQATDPSLFDLGSDFTIEVWVNAEWHSGVVVSKIHGAFAPQYELQVNEDGYRLDVRANSAGPVFSVGASPIILHEWVHVATTMSDSTLRIYIDGELRDEAPGPAALQPSSAFPFTVGGYPDLGDVLNAGTSVYGSVREVRLWDRALSTNEIGARASVALQGNEAGLIGYWPMSEGSGQSIFDAGPGGNDLIFGLEAVVDLMDPHWAQADIHAKGPYFSYEMMQIDPPGNVDFNGTRGAALDLDGDGDNDIIISQLGPDIPPTSTFRPLYALRNDGTGHLTDATAQVFAGAMTSHTLDEVIFDFDGDGLDDILLIDHGLDAPPFPGEQNRIFVQDGAGNLVEESWRLPQERLFSITVSLDDVDQDGDSDLFFGGCPCDDSNPPESSPRAPSIYLNQGNNTFLRDPTRVPDPPTNIWGSAFFDVDRDGDRDLIIADGSPWPTGSATGDRDPLYLNDGSGNFILAPDALPQRFGHPDWVTGDLVSDDLNLDGWPDVTLILQRNFTDLLFTAHYQLLLNDRSGSFVDISDRIDQSWPDPPYAVGNAFIETTDVNDDGWPDILLKKELRTRIHVNIGDANFREMSSVLPRTFTSYDVVSADITGDDLTDYVVSAEGSVHVFRAQKILDIGSIPAPTRTGLSSAGTTLLNARWDVTGRRTVVYGTASIDGITVLKHAPLNYRWIGRYLAPLPALGSQPDLAMLSVKRDGSILVSALDGTTGEPLRNTRVLSSKWQPRGMTVLPNLGGSPAVAVLAQRTQSNANAVETRNPYTGALIGKFTVLNKRWSAIAIQNMSNLSGYPDSTVAVLARSNDRRIIVSIVDAVSGELLNNVPVLSRRWFPSGLRVIPDVDGLGTPALAVMAERDDGKIIVQILNPMTDAIVTNVFPLSSKWRPIDFQILPDVDTDGSLEVVVLGTRDSDGDIKVQTRNLDTGAVIKTQKYFSSAWYAYGLAQLDDLDDDQIPELAVLAARYSDAAVKAQIRHPLTGTLLKTVPIE